MLLRACAPLVSQSLDLFRDDRFRPGRVHARFADSQYVQRLRYHRHEDAKMKCTANHDDLAYPCRPRIGTDRFSRFRGKLPLLRHVQHQIKPFFTIRHQVEGSCTGDNVGRGYIALPLDVDDIRCLCPSTMFLVRPKVEEVVPRCHLRIL